MGCEATLATCLHGNRRLGHRPSALRMQARCVAITIFPFVGEPERWLGVRHRQHEAELCSRKVVAEGPTQLDAKSSALAACMRT
mmetsp:Transcript_41655/g.103651  ORF Transcript_41655/g.103651 Transcript_41655/m.103651 type:complete len:84 (+) Transcript_41655:1172-1423(+)|eukprot:1814064-Prymnesium_polylepis.1